MLFRSEVMGIDKDYFAAVTKALIASGHALNPGEPILLSIADSSKRDAEPLINQLGENGYSIYATSGTANFVRALGYEATEVDRLLSSGNRNVVTVINDGTVRGVVNIPTGDRDAEQDGFYIRRAAVERRIPCFTSIDAARCAVEAAQADAPRHVEDDVSSGFNVLTLSEYVNG